MAGGTTSLTTSIATISGSSTLQGAQSAIRTPPKARQYCSPPQHALRHAYDSKTLHALEPRTVRAQERPQIWSPKLPRGAVVSRTDSESAGEGGGLRGPRWR
eukprot:11453373-Alexandrium_andersonii.AAC.1